MMLVISIHAPTRGATFIERSEVQEDLISIHAPTRGATKTLDLSTAMQEFQSTLPRGERRSLATTLPCVGIISIHAPTRGATICLRSHKLHSAISIHAPTRGATKSHSLKTIMHQFQSTLPRGERPDVQDGKIDIAFISIHAPTRGATVLWARVLTDLGYISIHAPTRGATHVRDQEDKTVEFQSTLPRGERQSNCICSRRVPGFQSTLPRGERQPASSGLGCTREFQSTLPRGERRK